MRFSTLYALGLATLSTVVPQASAETLSQLLAGRADLTTDVCGEVNESITVPNILFPGKTITIGKISACLCISDVSIFVSTNIFTIAASAVIGKAKVIATVTDMINKSAGHKTCSYPTHAIAKCQSGNPCGFTCKDGYTPSPASKPTSCVCAKPYKECNGKCGNYPACASGHSKRDAVVPFWNRKRSVCSEGLTACAVIGARTSAWDCVDTQSDLESCGGCAIEPAHSTFAAEGIDCTAIQGVSDVSCVRGACVVHRCMPGYDISADDSTCEYDDAKDPVLLAAQYGLVDQGSEF